MMLRATSSRQQSPRPASKQHAVVIGGSVAGLLAARALSLQFEGVTVIERDRFPAEPGFRRGVPQSRHLHVLLSSGAELLERLFPGFRAELLEAGATPISLPRETLWLMQAGWSQRFDHGVELLSCSRELLEWHIRRRTLSTDNVTALTEREAIGLAPDAGGDRVIGVRHGARDRTAGGDGAIATLAADFVVDASGRNSRAPEWLLELGYDAPEQTVISAKLGYASRFYAIPPDFAADWKALYLQPRAGDLARGGALFPMEGGRWIVTLGGVGGDYPPTDETAFLEFARGLRSRILYDTIRDAEPLTAIHGYQRTENQLRAYERLRRFPEQFVVFGDAACAFNPIYGQGMSVAAKEAAALHRELREQRRRRPDGDLTGLARRLQASVARAAAPAWLISTGEDLRYATTVGATIDARTKMMHRYFDRVLATATGNRGVNKSFVDVLNLQRPPTSLFRPSVLWPTLAHRTAAGHDPAATERLPLALPLDSGALSTRG